ncbi:Uncharacterized protein T05_7528 [Trichinella murrelli]|uniref:DUF676 domain-containing protein n=1 Tax=Trichinella murrelli TaxID=144512 RepID=A0A0V0UBP7_9BILA|nr:Uncharacterized protein T05_7528 [Trichinella murrelli]
MLSGQQFYCITVEKPSAFTVVYRLTTNFTFETLTETCFREQRISRTRVNRFRPSIVSSPSFNLMIKFPYFPDVITLNFEQKVKCLLVITSADGRNYNSPTYLDQLIKYRRAMVADDVFVSSVKLSLELTKLRNMALKLFGYYHIRCQLQCAKKLASKMQIQVSKPAIPHLFPGTVLKDTAIGTTFEVSRNCRCVQFADVIEYWIHIPVDFTKVEDKVQFNLSLELWHIDKDGVLNKNFDDVVDMFKQISKRDLVLNFSLSKGLHCHRPVLFDYQCLGAVSFTVHCSLISVNILPTKALENHFRNSCSENGWFSEETNVMSYRQLMQSSVASKNSKRPIQKEVPITAYISAFCLLLNAYGALQSKLLQLLPYLPRRDHINFQPLNCSKKFEMMEQNLSCCTCDLETKVICVSQIVFLSNSLNSLWRRFLQMFRFSSGVTQKLATEHHSSRVKRFADGVLVTENSSQALFNTDEQAQDAVAQLKWADIIRRSSYFKLLPELQIHCLTLDGTACNMPIFLEERFEPTASWSTGSGSPASISKSFPFKRSPFADNQRGFNCRKSPTLHARDQNKGSALRKFPCFERIKTQYLKFKRLCFGGTVFNCASLPNLADDQFEVHQVLLSDATKFYSDPVISVSGDDDYSEKGDETLENSCEQSVLHFKRSDLFSTYESGSSVDQSLLMYAEAKEKCRKILRDNGFSGWLASDFATLPLQRYYFVSPTAVDKSSSNLHLVVCVHGLEGSPCDLNMVKFFIQLNLPGENIDFLMSRRNQMDTTYKEFQLMTRNFVEELLLHISQYPQLPRRISFIGHSLGTIIIRSALADPRLQSCLPRLHTFLSLNGPHCGVLYNKSSFVNIGLWFMQKWKKSGSLRQLTMKDNADLRQCFLYQLSKLPCFEYFKYVLLVGSPNDYYVPLHSALIQTTKSIHTAGNSLRHCSLCSGTVYGEMVKNLLEPVVRSGRTLTVRYTVMHSPVIDTGSAYLLGRTAHIAVLDNDIFIEKFLSVSATALGIIGQLLLRGFLRCFHAFYVWRFFRRRARNVWSTTTLDNTDSITMDEEANVHISHNQYQ